MSRTQPDGYLAVPTTNNGKAILVLHAWWGLNANLKAFCDRLANAGFTAFAPDLYHGKIADNVTDAEAFGSALDKRSDQAKVEIKDAVAFLKERAGVSGVTVIGFSLGAYYALDLSASAPDDVPAVVIFYGTGPANFSQSKATYLGHFAGSDPYEPKQNVEWLEGELKNAGRPTTFYTYEGTGHWFFEPDRTDAYNKEAADLAWERTLEFLKSN